MWSVFIQIETVALKAVGLPEEGTFRIGGKRVHSGSTANIPLLNSPVLCIIIKAYKF